MYPPTGLGFLGGLFVLQIPGEKAMTRRCGGMALQQLALLAARYFTALVISHHRFQPGQRPAEGARRDLPRLVIVGEDPAGLGHAPDLDQRKTEALLERFMQLWLDRSEEHTPELQSLMRHSYDVI